MNNNVENVRNNFLKVENQEIISILKLINKKIKFI